MEFKISSPAFDHGQEIPKLYTGEGGDRSPPLRWSGVPEGAREFVLICEDPDAPAPEPFVHWLVYNISPSTSFLPEGPPMREKIDVPIRADQGRNSFGKLGYNGPLPPPGHGWHRYFFKLFALDAELALPAGATKEQLLKAMSGHIRAEAGLMGRYKREAKKGAA